MRADVRDRNLQWAILWLAVGLIGLVGRLVSTLVLEGRTLGGDHAIYLALANNILDGYGLVVDDPNLVDGMRATYPPLYPLLLATVGLVAPLGFATLAVLNTIIDMLCALVIWRLGRRLGLGQAGPAAAAVYLLWPTNLALAPVAHKEGLIALLVVGLAMLLHRASERPAARVAVAFGAIAGALALTQPALAPLPAILALLLVARLPSRRSWLRFVLVAFLAAMAAMVPWWLRNWLLFERFVPLTSAGGYGLWVGATPAGDGTWVRPPGQFLRGDEFAMSAALAKAAARVIAADPLGYILHCLGKLWRAFASDGAAATFLHLAEPRSRLALAEAWAFVATAVHVAVIAFASLFIASRRSPFLALIILGGLVQIVAFGIWFEFDQRHRYFLTPLLIPAAVSWLGSRIRNDLTPR